MKILHENPQSGRLDAPSLTRRKALALATGAILMPGIGARPVFAQATGTPTTVAGPPPLMELLACVPDKFLGPIADYSYIHWYYDDLKQQLDAFAIAPDFEAGMPDGFIDVTLPMPRPSSGAFDYALISTFTDAIGFQPLAVHQALWTDNPDHRVTLFRGGIDFDALPAAWKAAGYKPIEASSGHEVWTLGGPGDFDLTFSHPIQAYVLDAFNNLAILEGDILACAADPTILAQVAETQMAGAGSVAAARATQPLFAQVPSTTISCLAMPGAMFSREVETADSDTAVGPMPAWTAIIFGSTVGLRLDIPDATPPPESPDTDGAVFARILATSPDDAAQIGRVIEHRWNTGESVVALIPFTDLMTIADVGVEGSIATIDFAPVASAGAWSNMVFTGDFFPFIYGEVQT